MTFLHPTDYPVMPRQWRVIERDGKPYGVAMMPYPVLHPEDAACRGDRRFLLELNGKYAASPLKRWADLRPVCRACPLQAACAEWGIAHEGEWGMFGGLTPNERDDIRQSRQQLRVEPENAHVYDMAEDPRTYTATAPENDWEGMDYEQ